MTRNESAEGERDNVRRKSCERRQKEREKAGMKKEKQSR